MVPVQLLKRFSLFEGLTEGQLERIARLCREERYEADQVIFEEGSEAKNLYLLWRGKVALEMKVQPWPYELRSKSLTIEVMTPGQAFGWSALAEPHILTLSAKALERSWLLAIEGADLERLFEDDNQLGYTLIGRLASIVGARLRETRQKMFQFLKEAEVAREYAPEEATLLRRLRDFIHFRWVAALGVAAIALLAKTLWAIDFPLTPVFGVALAIASYNLLFWLYVRRLKVEGIEPLTAEARRIAYGQTAMDLVATTALIHYTGGVENPFIFYYLFHVIIASILLSPRVAYAFATLALLLFSSLVGLEYWGVVPHVHLGGFLSPNLYRQPSFVLAVLAAFATTLYVGCYLTTSVVGELRRRQWEVVALKDRLVAEAKALEETNKELVRLDRLKTHFLAMASHDLKTPLAAVESYLQVILGGFVGEVNEKHRHMLERSSIRIRELVALINRFLDFAHIERGEIVEKMEMTSLDEVVASCAEEARVLAAEKGLELVVEKPPTLCQIYASPGHLKQLLINLLGNAIKFTEEGRVTFRVEEKDDHIQMAVIDTGVGIDPQDMPRIFEDFYRGKGAEVKGTGLGLSIAKRIVEAHQGRIWAESPYAEGQPGSRFTVLIPKGLRKEGVAR